MEKVSIAGIFERGKSITFRPTTAFNHSKDHTIAIYSNIYFLQQFYPTMLRLRPRNRTVEKTDIKHTWKLGICGHTIIKFPFQRWPFLAEVGGV